MLLPAVRDPQIDKPLKRRKQVGFPSNNKSQRATICSFQLVLCAYPEKPLRLVNRSGKLKPAIRADDGIT
jgi:hypothetical protein